MNIDTWYLPSFYGDIRLDADDDRTKVIWFKLSGAEVHAMHKLREASISRHRKWTTSEEWEKVPTRAFEAGDPAETYITLGGRINKVEAVLTKALRPERKVLRVVRIAGGAIEEIHARDFNEAQIEAKHPYREEPAETGLAVREEDKPAVVATTVPQPALGCPAPAFEKVHKKATTVLKAFLSPSQVDDFERHQRIVVVGADTGHRYMVTSRNAPDQLRSFLRTVYDLDEQRPFCVHDWGIPAEEEVLTMALHLQIPGRERYLREIPDLLA